MDDLRFGCRHSLRHMKPGSCIINTTSVNAYNGNPTVLDYTATKGAIESFTRGLALQLIERGIRVNAVAPGPVFDPAPTSLNAGRQGCETRVGDAHEQGSTTPRDCAGLCFPGLQSLFFINHWPSFAPQC